MREGMVAKHVVLAVWLALAITLVARVFVNGHWITGLVPAWIWLTLVRLTPSAIPDPPIR